MSRQYKRLVLILFDSTVIFFAAVFSYFFLYPLVSIERNAFFLHLSSVIIVYIFIGRKIKIFDKINRFTSIREVVTHVLHTFFSFIVGTLIYIFFDQTLSLRYVTLTALISTVAIASSRVVWRLYIDHDRKVRNAKDYPNNNPIRTLLIGAGDGGAIFVRSLRNRSDIQVVGFLDDDLDKQNTTIYGYPVIGEISNLESIVEQYEVKQVTITIPSLSNDEMQDIVRQARKVDIKTNLMPYIEDVLSGDYQLDEFKEIEITDLLGRDEVDLDTDVISEQLAGKTVLVSGAGGSIGSEICRQVAGFSPKRIILVGHGEFSIYKIHRELLQWPDRFFEITPVIADIQDCERIFEVMAEYQPDIVYHAAAHKHVPLMEENPHEAVKNNILGTKNIGEASKAADVDSFVMISSDKAVNPPNVMGATKRIAEMIITGLNEKDKTKFVSVRFGNVLNSSGSVIPLFKEQIENGGPVTVTDFRMTRYFMTIPEASGLVLQAGALAEGGEIFILDMGTPVKIVDLARQMIWLSGYSQHEIGIVETGIRPGEKLYEELLATDENTERQVFDKIFVGKVENASLDKVQDFVGSLEVLSDDELKKELIDFANHSHSEDLAREA